MAFHRFLDLPPELRAIVYEFVAWDTTISNKGVYDWMDWRKWPGICMASHQTNDEAVPIVYRYAAFEAEVWFFNFYKVIKFVEASPPTCQRALELNDRLTTFLTDQKENTFLRVYFGRPPSPRLTSRERLHRCLSLVNPWLKHCDSRIETDQYIMWQYQAKRIFPDSTELPPDDSRWIFERAWEFLMLLELEKSLGDDCWKYELTRMSEAFAEELRKFPLVEEDSEEED